MWAAGVILFVMVSGFPPFGSARRGDWWYDRAAAGQWSAFWAAHERSARFSPDIKALLQAMLTVDPARRARVAECLKSHWARGGEVLGPAALEVRALRCPNERSATNHLSDCYPG